MDMSWLKTLVPMIGTALGGPLGGAAAAFLADRLGVDNKTVEAVSEVLNSGKMTPDQISALKLAEIDFQKFLKDNDIKIEEIAAKDRDSARTMQIATRSDMPAILTVFVTAGFFAVLGALMYNPEVGTSQPLMIMLGTLGTAWVSCVAFWVGTTSSSAQKTALIAQAQPIK